MPKPLSFAVVPVALAADAFAFHLKIATTNDHIWPRTEEDILGLAHSNQLLAAYYEPRDFVGLCYVKAEDKEWELGGLTVDPGVQGQGIGTTLARVAIAHTMAYNEPWKYGQELIAYVHQANNDPRKLLEKLGFAWTTSIEVPDNHAPPSMKRNEEGKIVGDKFRFTPEGLQRLSRWLDNESYAVFDERGATVNLGPVKIDDLRVALRDLPIQVTINIAEVRRTLAITAFSVQIPAAVAQNHLPRNEFPIVACEKRNQTRQMFRLRALLNRLIPHHAIERFLLRMLGGATRRNHPRHHRVNRDAVFAHLFRQHTRHAHHRAFAGHVRHLPGIGQKIRA